MSNFPIPMDQMPEYLKAVSAEKNASFVEGINAGAPPRIKLNGKSFVLVSSDGTETPFPFKQLVEGADGQAYMPIIILASKGSLVKSYYSTGYNPNEEGRAPDCFSNDGERPDKSVKIPMAPTCAQCQYNAFGSGTDEKGNATGGKACSDVKLLAVFVLDKGVFGLRVPPASLKGFRSYVQDMTGRNIPVDRVVTYLGFDAKASHPVLAFRFGGWVPQESVTALDQLAVSPEAMDAIAGFNAAAAPALPPPEKKAELPPPNTEKQTTNYTDVQQIPKEFVEKATQQPQQMNLNLGIPGLDAAPPTTEPPQKQVVPPPVHTEIIEQEPAQAVTDNDLAAALGIPGL